MKPDLASNALRAAGVLLSLVSAALARAQTQPSSAATAAPLSAALQADLGRESDDPDLTCNDLRTEPRRWGLIILGSDQSLSKAETKAREISRTTGVPFSTEGYSIDPETKRERYLRAYDDGHKPRISQCETETECITIEQSSAYTTLKPHLYIIVGAVLGEEAPQPVLTKYRASVPDAYVKYSTVKGDEGGYGITSGCMDWDLIVLARTAHFEEAAAIARAVSSATGIRYANRDPEASLSDTNDQRTKPFPNISVEADNAYNETGESPYFLVIGGDFGPAEDATLQLFERYKQFVPNTYRMKRARHVCGQ